MRLCFHPNGIRSRILDWDRFATALLHRLEREIVERPYDERLADLLTEARSYPDVVAISRSVTRCRAAATSSIPMRLDTPHGAVSFISMIATIGAPFDVTLEELRIETLLPGDRRTESVLRDVVGSAPGGDA